MIFIYNLLTPYMSDDYAYAIDVRQASSLWDLVKQQYGEYLSNSGRIIGQFNIRLSLSVSKHVFNVVNSFMFIALALLMYMNIHRRKKNDIFVLLLILPFCGGSRSALDRQCCGSAAHVIISGAVCLFWDFLLCTGDFWILLEK